MGSKANKRRQRRASKQRAHRFNEAHCGATHYTQAPMRNSTATDERTASDGAQRLFNLCKGEAYRKPQRMSAGREGVHKKTQQIVEDSFGQVTVLWGHDLRTVKQGHSKVAYRSHDFGNGLVPVKRNRIMPEEYKATVKDRSGATVPNPRITKTVEHFFTVETRTI